VTRLPRRPAAALAAALAAITLLGAAPTGAAAPAARGAARPAAAAPSVPRGLAGKNLERVPTHARVVALTFDGGGDAAGVRRILSTLAAQHVTATFFLTGRFAAAFPTWSRRIAALYPVANHTYSHPDLTHLSSAGAQRQITRGAAAIRAVIGRAPVHLFRFPYGAFGGRDVRLANALGYACVGWTVDTLGWMGTSGGVTATRVVSRVLRGAVPGEIVLMHLGSNPADHTALDADALPRIIAGLKARGYRFVTLPDALHVAS
jgi:peptidoglycan/xylan/chitin deacetylase (PgdA/CDA1 family)